MALVYRKDIDGLRTVAVLPVVLYHAGLGFPGGFVGVDVFFVISGYLITSLLLNDIRADRFSLRRFYERRARRILPALVAVVLASAIAGWFLFMPPDLTLFGKSATAAILFYANFLFRGEAGYFDAIAGVKPLLHTWSLAVEEQFYIVFPILLYGLSRYRRRRLGLMALLAAASLGLSIWWLERQPVDAFYLLPSRFWELGIGVMLALWSGLKSMGKAAPAVLVAIGIGMIGIAVLAIDAGTPFPGYAALLPCLGAGLVIFGGRTANPVSEILGVQPFVFLGRISYSLYLWHWPLIVFTQYRLGRVLTPAEACLVVAASIGIAALSWALIEQPIRHRSLLKGRGSLWWASLSSMAVLAGLGVTLKQHHGFPSRLPPLVASIYAAKQDTPQFNQVNCFTDSDLSGPTDDDARAGRLCSVGEGTVMQANFLVWGDSHAAAMAPGVSKAAAIFGRRGLLAGEGGCPPLLDYENAHSSKRRQDACVARNRAVLDLIESQHISLVFMIARWPREVLGSEYGQEGPYFDPTTPFKTEDRSALVASALDHTLATLTALHVKVVLVMDVPEIGYDVPYALAKAASQGRTVDVNPPRSVVTGRQKLALAILKAVAAKYDSAFIDPTPRFCNESYCNTAIDGRPLYVDADHITRTTAESLSGLFEPSFASSTSAITVGKSPASIGESALSQ